MDLDLVKLGLAARKAKLDDQFPAVQREFKQRVENGVFPFDIWCPTEQVYQQFYRWISSLDTAEGHYVVNAGGGSRIYLHDGPRVSCNCETDECGPMTDPAVQKAEFERMLRAFESGQNYQILASSKCTRANADFKEYLESLYIMDRHYLCSIVGSDSDQRIYRHDGKRNECRHCASYSSGSYSGGFGRGQQGGLGGFGSGQQGGFGGFGTGHSGEGRG